MRIAIIDGNNLAYRLYSQMKDGPNGLLTTSMGIPTTVTYGMLRMLNGLAIKHKYDRTVICWDVSGSKYRKTLFPEYKAHRKKLDMQDYYAELDSARDYFSQMGIAQGICKGIEADDVIGWLAYKFAAQKHKVTIVSDDKDYYQLCSRYVKIYRPIVDSSVNEFDVCDEFGIPKARIHLKLKALMGDKSDNIPGIRGIGDKTAVKLFLEAKTWSLKKLLKTCDHKRWGEVVRGAAKQVKLAYKLSRIRHRSKWYTPDELTLLEGCFEGLKDAKTVKVKTLNMLGTLLEIKAINLPKVLRQLGVNVIGKQKGVVIS